MSTEEENIPIVSDENRGEKSWGGRIRAAITVEPIAFLYNLAYVLSTSTNQQYASFYSAVELGGDVDLLSVGICSIASNSTEADWVADVQAMAADYLSLFSLINNLPMIVAAILMGSISDESGRRIALIAPIIGSTLRACIAIGVEYAHLDISYMYIGAALEGIFGGPAVIGLALFAYIADVSSTKSRSWRMLLIFVAEAVGIGLAEIAAGYLITYTDFVYPYAIVLGTYVLCFIIVVAYIRESVHTSPEPTKGNWFKCSYITRTFGLLFRQSEQGLTPVLWLAYIIMFLSFAAQGLTAFALYLYVSQEPLCFSWVQVGYLVAITVCLHAIGAPTVYRLLSMKFLDLVILALAATDGAIGQMYLAVPVDNTVYIYFHPLISFISGLVMPLDRAVISRSVSPEEQGAAQGIAAVCNVAGLMVGTVTATSIYSATVTTYSGWVFIFGAAIFLLIFLCCIALIRRAVHGQINNILNPLKTETE